MNLLKKLCLVVGLVFAFAKAESQVVINEFDANTPSTDTAEFIELKSDAPFFSLHGYVLVLFNGSSSFTTGMGRSYYALDLDSYTTDSNGLFVIGGSDVSPVADVLLLNNTIQNGTDAIALYLGNDTDWPEFTFASPSNLVQSVIYGTQANSIQNLINLLGQQPVYNEAINGNNDTESFQLKMDGTFEVKAPTPHALNDASFPSYIGLSFTTSKLELTEPDSFDVIFTLSQAPTAAFTLGFSFHNFGFNTADYTGATTFTIPAGQNSTTLSYTIVDDALDEGDESLLIDLDNNLPVGFKRLKDREELFVIDNDFQVAGYGTPLAPTYGNVSSSAPANYYNTINQLASPQLELAITTLIAEENIVRIHTYSDVTDILKEADVSPLNSNKVWLMYTEQERRVINFQTSSSSIGKWNREHIWSRSRGRFTDIEYDGLSDGMSIWTETNADSLRHGQSDAHHLRATDGPENSSRGNSDYPEYNGPISSQGSWHGDVARALFYMDLRYNNLTLVNGNPANSTIGQLGDLATLIQWHRNDPPDDFEMNRNNVVYNWQINRNPFIDLPDLVEFIYGNQVGQIFTLSEETEVLSQIVCTPNPTNNELRLAHIISPVALFIYDAYGRMVLTQELNQDTTIYHDLKSGIYLVHFKKGNQTRVEKLLVR
jgi:hypothetical protein